MSKRVDLNLLKHSLLTQIHRLDKELDTLDDNVHDLKLRFMTISMSSLNIREQLRNLKKDILERLDIPSP